MKKLVSSLLILQLLITTLIPSMAFGQEAEGEGEDFLKDTQNDVILVAAAGAAGAILGLSTLSFVDKPSKHIANVWTGAALGIITGVLFVAYNSAQKGSEELQSSVDFSSSDRLAWHMQNSEELTLPRVQFGTQIWSSNF